MIMLVDLARYCKIPFFLISLTETTELGKASGLDIRTMHEEVFSAMHRI